MRAEGFVPVPARPRRLCQPPWTQPINRKPRPTRMGANLQKNNQAYSQLLFGRGPGGGASLREAASPGVLPFSHLFEREREGGDFSAEKSPPSHPPLSLISFHLQRRGMRGIMQGIMEIKRCYVDSAVSRAIKEDEA